jgi:hypothetical protein
MGYLKEFGLELDAKLASLSEAERADIISFVKKEVLTSYRNGLRDAEQNRPPRERSERFAKSGRQNRKAPQKRNYQRQ